MDFSSLSSPELPIISELSRTDGESVTLDKLQHRYYSELHPEIEFTSATTFIGYFFEPFDTLKVAGQLVANSERYAGLTVEKLTEQWQQDTDEGSAIHEEIEHFLRSGHPPKRAKSKTAAQWLEHFSSPRYELFPEQTLFSLNHNLAGTADLLVLDKQTGEYSLYDWKTNKAITTTSFRGKKGAHPATNHLPDCHLSKYSLQLSIYKYLCEEHYNISIASMAIVHLKTTAVSIIPVRDLRSTFLHMLTFDRESVKQEYLQRLNKNKPKPLVS